MWFVQNTTLPFDVAYRGWYLGFFIAKNTFNRLGRHYDLDIDSRLVFFHFDRQTHKVLLRESPIQQDTESYV
jgi:hypothetical protein